MKLLLDQGTPRSSAALLRQAGFDAVHTGEIGLAEAPDEEILRRASLEDSRRGFSRPSGALTGQPAFRRPDSP